MPKFIKDLAERAIGTFAASAVAMLAVSASLGEVDWQNIASVAGLATLVTVLKSVAAKYRGNSDSASFVEEV